MANILKQIQVGSTTYNIEPYTAYVPLTGGTINANNSKAPLILKGGASDWNEGLRIIPTNNWATILLAGTDADENTGTSAKSWSIHNYDGSFYISKNGSDYASVKLSNTDGTWRVNDNAIIHSGNIGSQNVSYANSAGSANSVAWGNVSGSPFSGTSFVSGNSGSGEHNANNAIANGHYYYNSNGPATSLGASYTDGALYVQSHSDAWAGQIAQDYRNGSLFVRGKNNGSWSSWKRIIDSDNIGSQNVNYANSAGSANSVTLKDSSGNTTKATMQYNSTEDCIEFIFA